MQTEAQSVGYSYAKAQLNALCTEPAKQIAAPEWFGDETVATFVNGRGVRTFVGRELSGYAVAVSEVFADAAIQLEDVQVAPGPAGSITTTLKGTVRTQNTGTSEPFSITSVLGQTETKDAYYTMSETFVLTTVEVVQNAAPAGPTAAEPEAAEADAEVEEEAEENEPEEEEAEESETPPSPPTSPQDAAVPVPAAPAVVAEPAAAKPAAPAEAPRPKSWAGIASLKKDAPVTAAPAPEPRPAAKAAAPAPKKAPEPRKEVRKVEVTATFKVQAPVSDADLRKAIPSALEPSVLSIRNQSAGDLKRVWIEFAAADAVSRMNEAGFALAGRTINVESQRKKN